MHVSPTPEPERRIEKRAEAELCNTVNELVREPLPLIHEGALLREQLRAEFQIGSEQLRRGEGIHVESEEEFQSLARAGR
jgi:hypothetical protein